jgi:PadR family transcriptional regulator, regulatory protein AphA
MSRAGRLTPFSYVILALVGRGGAGPHDIVRMMREGAIFWTTSESHYYAEPRRLATLGFLQARTEPGRTRPRTHYELTDAGR